VVRVDDADYPAFCRVIWNAHVREMTDLSAPDRAHLMDVVFAVETVLRRHTVATKINLASLGNLTPHLHWHVIPRFADDRHFPAPVWAEPKRDAVPPPAPPDAALRRALEDELGEGTA
jgi:diadenosine tetraphosphate (Ap4A) HIT family hydrolase